MRNFLFILTLIWAATAQAQTVTIVQAADSGMVQLRTITVSPNGSENSTTTRPMTQESALGELLVRYQQASEEVAAYETRLVESRKRADNLLAQVQSLNGDGFNTAIADSQKRLIGDWVLSLNDQKVKFSVDGKGVVTFSNGKDKGATATANSPKSFVLAGFFTKTRLFGLFDKAIDVTFFQQDDQVWRGKADKEVILIHKK